MIEPIDRQFDLVVVDPSAHSEANNSAVAHSAPGATILVLGLDDRPLGLTARTLVRRQLELRGSLTYDHPVDFGTSIELLSSAKLDPAGSSRTSSRLTTRRCVRSGTSIARQDVVKSLPPDQKV